MWNKIRRWIESREYNKLRLRVEEARGRGEDSFERKGIRYHIIDKNTEVDSLEDSQSKQTCVDQDN